jgi:hypothetical protein
VVIPDIHRHRNHHHQIFYHHHHRHCNAPEVYVCESCIEFSLQWLYLNVSAEYVSDTLQ